MRRFALTVALIGLTTALLAGCDDPAAKKAAEEAAAKRQQVVAALSELEMKAKDPSGFVEVMREVGKRRAQAWGDSELLKKIDEIADAARAAREVSLKEAFAKAETTTKGALAISDAEPSAKACSDAIYAVDRV